jgi:D-alanyl-D-alanine-carboxypeptidase/D-alanyl-D-alanine-endopeptidase
MALRSPLILAALSIRLLTPDAPAHAQVVHSHNVVANASTTDSVVDQAILRFVAATPQVVGLSVGVFKNGAIYTYNYGTVERGKHQPPTENTIYRIASITKTFTATLLAQAAVDRRVKLDDDVRKYLDGDYPNLEFQGHPIRLYDLVDHRSGLPFFLPDKPETAPDYHHDVAGWPTRIADALRSYSRQDFYADLHHVQLDGIPGEQVHYSNAAAQLMGYILERVYHRSYETLLKEKIFAPLDMESTAITLDYQLRGQLAKGYDSAGHLMPDVPDQLQAAGAVKSTVSDLLKYVQWQVEENDGAVKLSHIPRATIGDYSADLNWQMWSSDGNRLIWQSGNFPGFHSLCATLPELKLGLVILANESDPASNAARQIMANEILSGLDPRAIPLPQ